MKAKLRYVLSLAMIFSMFSVMAQQGYWQKTNGVNLAKDGQTTLKKEFYQTYNLNIDALKSQLANAPLRSSVAAMSNTTIFLPNIKGEFEQFRVVETPVLSEELSAQYPNIKTYLGFSTENPGVRARFSVTPQGLQTMVSYPDAPINFTVPTSKTDNTSYLVYSREVRSQGLKDYSCLTEDEFIPMDTSGISGRDANDQILRTFRIAISTNGEYTNFWDDGNAGNGDAQDDALAQVVATLNRSNDVFEVDMAVTFTLVNGTEIIYPDAGSDPYTGAFNAQLQATLTSEVGEANYDIGHLFAFGGNNGNAGCIGCVCVDGQKGSGFSSHTFLDNDGGPYMSDFFDIDYVPHEIGHQMGANHTWSFNSEGTGVNMEPGSGTTIMGYAGITGANDVQDHSDPYFHYASIDQILDNLIVRTCWTSNAITNNPPVANAGADFTIPGGTAFILKGDATDADGSDVLTYTWEQIDNGVTTSGTFGPTKTTGAVWRSRPPSTSPDRYMPIIERVLANQLTETNPVETTDNSSWETVSTVSRTLNFALVVKDRSEANGTGQFPQSDFDEMMVTVDGTAGPFVVTSQATTETWDAGSTQTITWDVAGTDGGAVNTPTVNILLSTDGGLTFPFTMASNVPNDGTHDATVPSTGGDTTTARVRVEGNNNIFYAINSANIAIQESEFVLSVTDADVDVCSPNDAIFNFTYNTFLGFAGTTNFSATGLPVGATAVFSPASASADGTAVTVTVSGIGSLATGNYPFQLVGTSGSISQSVNVEFNVFDATLATPTMLMPADAAVDVLPDGATLSWSADTNATAYEIDVATDAGFTSIISGTVVATNSFTIPVSLNTVTQYFWRVRGVNDCGIGSYAQASFTTANISCIVYNSSDTPVSIPDNTPGGADSTINVSAPYAITDINVTVNITHTWASDLILTLISPNGTEVILSSLNGSPAAQNYTNTVFDQEATNTIASSDAPFTGTFIPDEDLSVLYGTASGGDWVLNISDNATFDTGSLVSWSMEICGSPLPDADGDSIPDADDNCPTTANADQADLDEDNIGDVCDDDIDGDTILNVDDNCPIIPNTDQADLDMDNIGDACDCSDFTSSNTPVVISGSAADDTVYEVELSVTQSVDILDVNVTIDITHTWVEDLDIFIESPDGTSVELSTFNGGNGDNYTSTTFDQQATVPITSGLPPFTGTFQPEGNLNDFVGSNSGGIWKLVVIDTFGAFDGGTITNFTVEFCGPESDDQDGDGIADVDDNCPTTANTDQADLDDDGIGDVCDDDIDGDTVLNVDDNCPANANMDQSDIDEDGIGDVCDVTCETQTSSDTPIVISDGAGGAIYEATVDMAEQVLITDVNVTINIDHTWDSDLDIELVSPTGTIVELTSGNGGSGDNYTDTVFDQEATTPITAGSAPFTGMFVPEGDLGDFYGSYAIGLWTLRVTDTAGGDGGTINNFMLEVCGTVDPNDFDFDGILNPDDNCLFTVNPDQSDIDDDGMGDVCDDDIDGDGILNAADNCPNSANVDQADNDEDGIGDVCDDDDDNDGVLDISDNCQFTPNPDQLDYNFNGVGDVCDSLLPNDMLTPNGDNINDVWTVMNAERYPDAIIVVYNRSGNEVFSTIGYNNDWAGTFNGDTLPTGSYYYRIDQDGDGVTILTGWLYLTL